MQQIAKISCNHLYRRFIEGFCTFIVDLLKDLLKDSFVEIRRPLDNIRKVP